MEDGFLETQFGDKWVTLYSISFLKKKISLVLFRPLITFSFCSHNPSKLPAERSKNKNKCSCFEAYCLNNCNTPQTCGPISYLLLGFPANQSQLSAISSELWGVDESKPLLFGWQLSVTVFNLSLKSSLVSASLFSKIQFINFIFITCHAYGSWPQKRN